MPAVRHRRLNLVEADGQLAQRAHSCWGRVRQPERLVISPQSLELQTLESVDRTQIGVGQGLSLGQLELGRLAYDAFRCGARRRVVALAAVHRTLAETAAQDSEPVSRSDAASSAAR